MLRRWLEPRLGGMFGFLDFCGILDYAQPWLTGMGLILMFHRVVTPRSLAFDPGLAICSDNLDRILGYIRRRSWEIISLGQLHDRLTNGSHRRPFVCITFDDGYADNFTIGLPIFRRHQAPLCVNVTVGYINRTTPGWWDALGELLLQRKEIQFSGSGQSERVTLGTWEEKLTAYQRLGKILYHDVIGGRAPLGNTWSLNGVDAQALSDRLFLTWKELQEFSKDPLVEIGAHTLTHPSLKDLKENEAADEIEQSRRILKERLEVEIEHFAYPFGLCGEREFRLVRDLKFKTAVTARFCNIFAAHREHLASLPRKSFSIHDVPESTARARLYGEDWVGRWISGRAPFSIRSSI
jgi:peptidoglycan/xylan/chitin deacetylase (PgdA/CDA1 family)